MFSIGVDVGGTFTDLVCANERGEVRSEKLLTTPEDQAVGVLQGIEQLARSYGTGVAEFLGEVSVVIHGTTVATNTMLEYKGARTGLITTAGFRDTIEIRRNYKEAAFDIHLSAPHQIVPRRRRLGVTERINYAGEIVKPLDEDEVRTAAARLAADGIESLAICFLFSFLNPIHEQRARDIVREQLPDLHISLSSEVLPQVREFERLSTTLVDAYVTPGLRRYLGSLANLLAERGFAGETFIMQGNGGVVGIEEASRRGIHALLSGPASGVVAGAQLGHLSGFENVITVDMGGTSFDVCLVQDGQPKTGTDQWMSRYRVAVPFIDIHTIGAGGGSIAWVDEGGALRVGPESAGARPGPACYGFGGREPTVTDADLVLGYIDPGGFLGGDMRLDLAAAKEAIESHVAKPMGMTVTEAAAGVFRIVNHGMSNSVRQVSLSKGYDPRDFALTAFGGAGAIHASALTEDLGIRRVLVPKGTAPVLCALGDLLSDLRVSRVRSFYGRSGDLRAEALAALCEEMRGEAGEELANQEADLETTLARFSLEMRYLGQTHEVTVPLSGHGAVSESELTATFDRFHELHEQLYTFKKPGDEIEVLSVQLDLIGVRHKPSLPSSALGDEDPAAALRTHRPVYSFQKKDYVSTPIYDGDRLQAGHRVDGPAVIEEARTSIVLFPEQSVRLDAYLTYVIETGR